MAFELHTCSPAGALETLAEAISAAKCGDRLAQVTVVVPTNAAGVMARRALGRGDGILGVDMVTLNRLAELLAGPGLAHQNRQPVATPLLDLSVRTVLDEAPGSYEAVARHPATVVALRDLHRELRLVGADGRERLATTARGREAVRVSAAVTRLLQRRWYDEADLLAGATEIVRAGRARGLERIVLHLPQPFDPLGLDFVRALGEDRSVSAVVSLTGDDGADHEQHRLLEQLDPIGHVRRRPPPNALAPPKPERVVSTTDADDEVRIAVRAVIDAARGTTSGSPVPFDRIAILWPTHRPYARLVEHHLTADGISWNGRGGTELVERIAPRLLLDLLDVDRRGLQRRELFELLADIPAHDADGRLRRTAEWERASRVAGVSRDADWIPRLGALAANERWKEPAESLMLFVAELRATLGHPRARRKWAEWVDWSTDQLSAWLGKGAITRFSDAEYRAWEALMSALERLRFLDDVAEPVDRHRFRTVLETELDDAAIREGRIGSGVTIGSLASAGGLDIDVAIVVGAADGLLPPPPVSDPLLSDADRERAGLPSSDERASRLHHEFVGLMESAHTIVTVPRGDLRATTFHQMSRWLGHLDESAIEVVDSSTAGLARLDFAPCERERRLCDRLGSVDARGLLPATDPAVSADGRLRRAFTMRRARESADLTPFDGDLSGVSVPRFDEGDGHPVSPTQIEAWASCPHAYFVKYLLKVREVDEPDAQISIRALDQGLVQHDTLDSFHRDVIAGRLPQPTDTGWTSAHREALLAHFDRQCERAERGGRTGRPATWANERERMRADLLDWLDHDGELARIHGVEVVASEHRFTGRDGEAVVNLPLVDGRHLPVQGSIDRLDARRDGTLVVTDHKTGGVRDYKQLSSDDPTLGGTVFQLPTYAAAAHSLAPAVSAGRDAPPAVRAEYSMFAKGEYRRFGFEFSDDVWERVGSELTTVVDGIESGWFPQIPDRPGYRHYISCIYCEPDTLGTAEAWGRWSAKRHDRRIARWFADPADDEPTAADESPTGADVRAQGAP